MKSIIKAAFLMIGIALLMQCSNDDDLYLTADILQGTWVEAEPEHLLQFAGENHTFKFVQDSFYLKINSWTDVVYEYDTTGDGSGNVYFRGQFFVEADTIRFNGFWCPDSTYCKNTEANYLRNYKIQYKYEMRSRNEFVLDPDYEKEGFSIRLVKQK